MELPKGKKNNETGRGSSEVPVEPSTIVEAVKQEENPIADIVMQEDISNNQLIKTEDHVYVVREIPKSKPKPPKRRKSKKLSKPRAKSNVPRTGVRRGQSDSQVRKTSQIE